MNAIDAEQKQKWSPVTESVSADAVASLFNAVKVILPILVNGMSSAILMESGEKGDGRMCVLLMRRRLLCQ